MIAAIDSGNSSIKLGIFDQGSLIKSFNSDNLDEINRTVLSFPVKRIVISDVGGRFNNSDSLFPENINILKIGSTLKFPFTIRYRTPGSLGPDRIAAVAGAWSQFGPANILIIDSGTCLTYDFIDHQGNYLGGGISPGISMRFRALHEHTIGLPEIKPAENFNLIGSDTTSSILNGTLGGVAAEIRDLIGNFRGLYDPLKVVFCGGNAGFFETIIKDSIFVVPQLVLWGLAVISGYNEI